MKMASPGLKCVNLDAQACEFFGDYFAQQLATATGVRITTRSEISSVLGFERRKPLLGCSETANSCLAEMAGALGVDALIIGNLAKFGDSYVPNIKIIPARDGQAISTQTGGVNGDNAILDWMGSAAKAMAGQLGHKPAVPTTQALRVRGRVGHALEVRLRDGAHRPIDEADRRHQRPRSWCHLPLLRALRKYQQWRHGVRCRAADRRLWQ